MKKLIILFALISISLSSKAQLSCNGFNTSTDLSHFTVANVYDTTYLRQLHFNLSDTVNLSKIKFTLTEVNGNPTITTQDINFDQANAANILTAWSYRRTGKGISISLGYLPYTMRYRVNIKLYDLQNTEISSSNYEF